MDKITINLSPITKKNSMQIVRVKGRPMLIPSKQYRDYEKAFLKEVSWDKPPIDYPVNIKCTYYMPTRRRVDLTNLLEATHDCLVKANVLEDDNSKIVVSVDGSRVSYDKGRPRTEVEIDTAFEMGET